MNELQFINNEGVIQKVLCPALFDITCDIQVANYKIHGQDIEEAIKTTHQLFKCKDGGFALVSHNERDGIKYTHNFNMADMVFPVSLFKKPEFIDFLKTNNLDKSKHNFIFQTDPAAPLRVAYSDHKARIFSDLKPIAKALKPVREIPSVVMLFDLGDELGLLTDIFSDNRNLELIKVNRNNLDQKEPFKNANELLEAIMVHLGYNEQMQTQKRSVFSCFVAHEDIYLPTVTVITTKQDYGREYEIKIYGTIFAEHDYKNIKVICFSSTHAAYGIGMVLFYKNENGDLRYIRNVSVNTYLGKPYSHGDDLENRVINTTIHKILSNNGVTVPAKYIGILKDAKVESDCQPVLDGCLYGKPLFNFSVGESKRIIGVVQYGDLFIYEVDEQANKVLIFESAYIFNVINSLNMCGGDDAKNANVIIDHMLKYNKLQAA